MSYQFLTTERKGRVLVVTINREKVLNALNIATVDELRQVFESHWGDAELGCVLLTGAGEKAFVAGADINELNTLDAVSGRQFSANGLYVMKLIHDFPVPVIAVINGFALGGGSELALACDIRLASEKAKIGEPEVTLGIIPGFGGTQRLPRLVGRAKAIQIVCTGDMMTAAEAYRIGYVDEVYPHEELMTKAMAMAETICSRGPMAVRLAKEAINRGQDVNIDTALDFEKANFAIACGTNDKTEGTRAFLEKRKPNFTGK